MRIVDSMTAFLRVPAAYRLFRTLVAGDLNRHYVAEYVKPLPGAKVLDIGCGPGDMLVSLPNVNYTGIDISPEYIAAATKRFGHRGRFVCQDVGLATIEREHGEFDLALATGLIHHLDDQTAGKLFELARLALKPNGRFITFDGCYVPEQSRWARWVISKDRGKFVRNKEAYVSLASIYFSKVDAHVRHDLLRIPYTHLIMSCSDGKTDSRAP